MAQVLLEDIAAGYLVEEEIHRQPVKRYAARVMRWKICLLKKL